MASCPLVGCSSAKLSADLWQFVVSVYRMPDVEHKCLHLQRSKGINISFLLWGCWCWRNQVPVDQKGLAVAAQVIASTHENLVLELRKLRYMVDGDQATIAFAGAGLEDEISRDRLRPLRQAILGAEIEGEKLVLHQLATFTESCLSGGTDVPLCLRTFFDGLSLSVSDCEFFERNIAGAMIR